MDMDTVRLDITKAAYNEIGKKRHGIAKFIEADMGPTWGRQDPGDPHVGPINLAIWISIINNITHNEIGYIILYSLPFLLNRGRTAETLSENDAMAGGVQKLVSIFLSNKCKVA